LLLLLNPGDRQQEPTAAEIEQGRRDLAIALTYLGRAGQKAGREIDSSINRSVVGSIRKNTLRVLRHQIDT
jgi:hypothetical protein